MDYQSEWLNCCWLQLLKCQGLLLLEYWLWSLQQAIWRCEKLRSATFYTPNNSMGKSFLSDFSLLLSPQTHWRGDGRRVKPISLYAFSYSWCFLWRPRRCPLSFLIILQRMSPLLSPPPPSQTRAAAAEADTWDTSRRAAQQCANMKRHIRVIGVLPARVAQHNQHLGASRDLLFTSKKSYVDDQECSGNFQLAWCY